MADTGSLVWSSMSSSQHPRAHELWLAGASHPQGHLTHCTREHIHTPDSALKWAETGRTAVQLP